MGQSIGAYMGIFVMTGIIVFLVVLFILTVMLPFFIYNISSKMNNISSKINNIYKLMQQQSGAMNPPPPPPPDEARKYTARVIELWGVDESDLDESVYEFIEECRGEKKPPHTAASELRQLAHE